MNLTAALLRRWRLGSRGSRRSSRSPRISRRIRCRCGRCGRGGCSRIRRGDGVCRCGTLRRRLIDDRALLRRVTCEKCECEAHKHESGRHDCCRPRQQIRGPSPGHETAHPAAATDSKRTTFAALKQHDGDERDRKDHMNYDEDCGHCADFRGFTAGPIGRPRRDYADSERLFSASGAILPEGTCLLERTCLPEKTWAAHGHAWAMAQNSSALRLAPPTSAPSTSPIRRISVAFDALTEPP
jgi:hypothetical protein